MTIHFNIIGAGNLGKTLGYLLSNNARLMLKGVCNNTLSSAARATEFIGSGNPYRSIEELPEADITLITTPDDAIVSVSQKLSKTIQSKTIVLHCSGSLSSDVLGALKEKGCFVASVHPMRSFANAALSIKEFKGTFCAMEGDDLALEKLTPLFKDIGANTYLIDKNKKNIYHAAGVFASNYLVTLSSLARECLREASVGDEIAMQIITSLMQSTVSNLHETLSPEASLTGPIQRGDISTISQHIGSFHNQDLKEIYKVLGKATLEITDRPGELKEKIKKSLLQE